jgi:GH43 family beta-xylosidase
VADSVLGPYRDEWNAEGPSVLKGIEGQILGPGHNSVVLGPDGKTPFMVYHAWDANRTARRMFIDPIRWEQGKDGRLYPRVAGPTMARQTL